MRGGLILSALLLMIALSFPQAMADDKVLYDKWHFSGDSFTVDKDIISLTHFNVEDPKVYVKVNSQSFIVRNGECQVTQERRYCIKEIYTDIGSATEKDHIKFIGRDVYAGLHIIVYARESSVTVTRTFSSATPYPGDVVTATITINNPTDFSASAFSYADQYPQEITILSAIQGSTTDGRAVKFNGKIQPGEEKIFTYTFVPINFLKLSNTAVYSYNLGSGLVTKNTTTYTFDTSAKKPYLLTAKSSKSSIETGDTSELTVTIENKQSNTLKITQLEIGLPSQDISIAGDSPLQRETGKYSWSGDLANATKKEFNLRAKPSKPGKYNIPITIKIQYASNVYLLDKASLNLTGTYVEPELIFSIKEPSISEGGVFRAAFSVTNKNKHTSFVNVNAVIQSNLSSEASGQIAAILPGESKTIVVKENMLGPSVEKQTVFTLNAFGHYDTQFGVGKSFSKSGTVTVSPVEKAVTIIRTLDKKGMVQPGDNITVTVKAKSNNQENVLVQVDEIIPKGVQLAGGSTSQSILFETVKELPAYIYKISIPQKFYDAEIKLTTVVKIAGKPGIINQTTVVLVNATKAPIIENVEPTEDEPTEVNNTTTSSAPLTFATIVDGVTNFFKRILGFG